jgi:hypothetical protein
MKGLGFSGAFRTVFDGSIKQRKMNDVPVDKSVVGVVVRNGSAVVLLRNQ